MTTYARVARLRIQVTATFGHRDDQANTCCGNCVVASLAARAQIALPDSPWTFTRTNVADSGHVLQTGVNLVVALNANCENAV